ncbi:MAG: hypothetical protein WKF37_06075 [Bryobacteraceae bacterium]
MSSTYELLDQLAAGKLGFDHRVLHAICDNPEAAIPDLVRWGLEDHEEQLSRWAMSWFPSSVI